ncbi:MAG: hypothetical protein IKQ39_07250 [Oscillospiraceae bacterium]|nr:hypothetical protein [Oscillospiraceae bacterium]
MKQNDASDRDVKIYDPLHRIGQPPAMPRTDPEADETVSVWRPGSQSANGSAPAVIQ